MMVDHGGVERKTVNQISKLEERWYHLVTWGGGGGRGGEGGHRVGRVTKGKSIGSIGNKSQ